MASHLEYFKSLADNGIKLLADSVEGLHKDRSVHYHKTALREEK